MTTTSTTLIRYSVLARDDPAERACDWHPYETRADADDVRRALDRRMPDRGPHRVVRVALTITEGGEDA